MTDVIMTCYPLLRPDTKPDQAARYTHDRYELERAVTQWGST
jgi:hypothetical protein